MACSIFNGNFIINIHFSDYSEYNNKLFYAEENKLELFIIPIFCILSKVILQEKRK